MKKRILSFVPTGTLEGGGEKSFFEVLCFLQKHGHSNYVIVPRDSSGEFLKTMDSFDIKYIVGEYSSFGLHGDRSIFELEEVISISKIIQTIKPDIFITNLYIEPSQWAAALCNVPHIYFDRGQLGLMANNGELPDTPPEFTAYANAILCNSKNGQNILKDNYGIASKLVYSYVIKPEAKLRKNKKPRIIMPANFFREKNHMDVLAAIARIRLQQPQFDTELIFMGSKVSDGNSEYYSQILEYIEKNKLNNIVHIIDYKDKPWEYFCENDIYVNSGEGEAVGRATAEAEMLGITALIADIPGHWEHKNLFGNHYTFKLHDIENLANQIVFLLDESNRQQIVEHNRKVQEKIEKWMTPDNTMGEILGVIETIHSQDNPARVRVYSDILSAIRKIASDHEQLKRIEGSLAGHMTELEILRKPGVKLAVMKLGGSVKRKLKRMGRGLWGREGL